MQSLYNKLQERAKIPDRRLEVDAGMINHMEISNVTVFCLD